MGAAFQHNSTIKLSKGRKEQLLTNKPSVTYIASDVASLTPKKQSFLKFSHESTNRSPKRGDPCKVDLA